MMTRCHWPVMSVITCSISGPDITSLKSLAILEAFPGLQMKVSWTMIIDIVFTMRFDSKIRVLI